MDDKKNTMLIISLVLIGLFSAFFSASYAYFQASVTVANLNVTATTPTVPTFTSHSPNSLNLNITTGDMLHVSDTPSKTDTGTIVVTLASSDTSTVYCTYDIALVLDSASQYSPSTTLPYGNFNYELSLKGSGSTTGDASSTSTNPSLSETNLDKFSWSGTAGTVGRTATLISGAKIASKSTSATTTTWTFTLNFYTLPVSQSSLQGKIFAAHFSVTNVRC